MIYEAGICSFSNELVDIPIDRHDIEINYLNGIVGKKLSNKEIIKLGTIWVKEYNISPCDIDKYLWLIGNVFCLLNQILSKNFLEDTLLYKAENDKVLEEYKITELSTLLVFKSGMLLGQIND